MYRFQQYAPLDLTPYAEPPAEDRSGPPLSRGSLLTLFSTVAAEHFSPERLELLMQADPEAWYHGQLFETLLNEFERQDPELPGELGKNIYYMLRSQFIALGLSKPADVISTFPWLWKHVTRGDSGEWRSELIGPQEARLELEQPYNCRFEQGAVQGALEAFDALDVAIEHVECMRDGRPACVLLIRWKE